MNLTTPKAGNQDIDGATGLIDVLVVRGGSQKVMPKSAIESDAG